MEGTRGSHHCWGFFKHKLYSNNPDRHYSPRYIPSTETIHTPTHYIIPVLYMARPPLCCHYGITHKYKIGQSTKRLVTSDICRICFDWPCSSVFLCVLQATYRPFLRQVLEEIFHPDRPESPDIEHMSGGLTDLLKTGFSMFMKVRDWTNHTHTQKTHTHVRGLFRKG